MEAFDDAVNQPLWDKIMMTVANRTNPNGCPVSATFFVSAQYTDFWRLQQLYGQGHEIATHTVNHIPRPSLKEVVSAREMYSAFGGIPKDKINGFRAPTLNYTTETFDHLYTSGFLYDSSMQYHPVTAGVWPHTLDFGPVVNCVTGDCNGNFAFPGLWEVPMYTLLNPDGSLNSPMDPNPVGAITKEAALELLRDNFKKRYEGDRLPMGVYSHAAAMNAEAIAEFVTWTQKEYKDVYWVNNQQLLAWVNNPTDVTGSLKNPALDCQMPAKDPNNKEICDGVDNDNNGEIDTGLVRSCAFQSAGAYFSTCFGCPVDAPTVDNPTPPQAQEASVRFRIQNVCSNDGVFDPMTGNCETLKRMAKPNIDPTTTNGDPKAPPKSKSGDMTSLLSAGSLALAAFSLLVL
jgi:hypothetical protein